MTDEGTLAPSDGKTMGELQIRCFNINYFKTNNQENFTADGWFKTGDVSTIDPDGGNKRPHQRPHQSGGEWISRCTRVRLNGTPNIREAAVIAIPDENG
jgi:fatty-acyl-CoA synthase